MSKKLIRKHTQKVLCPYCGGEAEFLESNAELYDGVHHGSSYICRNHGTELIYVGCHPNTDVPLGTLADAKLRRFRGMAHRDFDPLWKSGKMSRSAAYHWLSQKMGLEKDACHIAMFDVKQCMQVMKICALNGV